MTIRACLGYVTDTGTPKGRGVFAGRKINAGELVEACPVVVITTPLSRMPKELKSVVFDWGYLTNGQPSTCLALGWGSMYNSANPANLKYVAVANDLQLHFIAARDIQCDEELTINYNHTGGEAGSSDDTWFRTRGMQQLP